MKSLIMAIASLALVIYGIVQILRELNIKKLGSSDKAASVEGTLNQIVIKTAYHWIKLSKVFHYSYTVNDKTYNKSVTVSNSTPDPATTDIRVIYNRDNPDVSMIASVTPQMIGRNAVSTIIFAVLFTIFIYKSPVGDTLFLVQHWNDSVHPEVAFSYNDYNTSYYIQKDYIINPQSCPDPYDYKMPVAAIVKHAVESNTPLYLAIDSHTTFEIKHIYEDLAWSLIRGKAKRAGMNIASYTSGEGTLKNNNDTDYLKSWLDLNAQNIYLVRMPELKGGYYEIWDTYGINLMADTMNLDEEQFNDFITAVYSNENEDACLFLTMNLNLLLLDKPDPTEYGGVILNRGTDLVQMYRTNTLNETIDEIFQEYDITPEEYYDICYGEDTSYDEDSSDGVQL